MSWGGRLATFDRYLLSQLMALFGFFALVLVSVYWLNHAVRMFEQLIGDGQSALVFLEFTALALPNVIRLVLPVAAFAAAVYITNRLTSESELIVVQAMGISPLRMSRAVAVFGLLVAALVLVLNSFLVPLSRAELADRKQEIDRNITARLLSEGRFLHPAPGITFYIREITPAGELKDVFLSDARSDSQRTTYTARAAQIVAGEDGPKLVMFDGMAQTLRHDGQKLFTTMFGDSVFDIAALTDPEAARRKKIEELSTLTLIRAVPDALAETGRSRAEFLYEGHARLAQPLLAVSGAMLGFAALMLGGFSRFGLTRQVLGAVGLLILVQLLDNAAADLARQSAAAWPVVYAPPLAGIAIAIALMAWAGRARRARVTGAAA